MKSHIANLITIGNISFGGASIMATIHESYNFAVLFIFIAAFLDRYDGKVARKFNQESELGKQLDSMSDIISFGVAPAILMYEMTLMQFGTIGMIVAVLYIACGAFRLARFNITESNGYFLWFTYNSSRRYFNGIIFLYTSIFNCFLYVFVPNLIYFDD